MSTRKIIIGTPIINELVFDYLMMITPEQKKKFNPRERLAIRTSKRARYFVSKLTLDEKLLTLAKLGVQFSFILHKNTIDEKAIKEMYSKYKKMGKTEFLDEMVKEKIVVLTDRVLSNYLNVMGQFSHSDTYLLNMDFHRVGSMITNWKEYETPDADNILESVDFARTISSLFLNLAMALKTIKGDTDIADLDLILLMYLHNNQTKYVPRETIDNYLFGLFRKPVITSAIRRISEKLYIDRNPLKTAKSEYQITALGSTTVMEFIKKILSKTV